ncbi:MAG: hypothetical protein ACP5VE_07300 [Chthonomonadales bacterium]
MTDRPMVPPAIGIVLVLLAVSAGIMAALWWKRRLVRRAWGEVARALGGALDFRPGTRAMAVHGTYRGHTAFLGEGTSFEDGVPYHHTRGALSTRNPARVVMGLRRKSLLEEHLTRREENSVATGDPLFDRSFFLVASTPEHAQKLLPEEVRAVLTRWNDVEVYVKGGQIAWRRASRVRSARDMMALFEAIAQMADVLAELPPRELTPEEQQEEERLIEHGI